MNEFNIDLNAKEGEEDLTYLSEQIEEQLGSEEVEPTDNPEAQEQATAEAKPKLRGDDRELDKDDPRADGVGFNLPDIAAETMAAVTGGLRDTASSALTFGERAIDMVNGEMEREGADYEPEFNILGGDLNPITTTGWGKFIRGGVHFASMTVGLVAAAKAILPAGAVAAIGGLSGVGGTIAKGALIGGSVDLVSEYSQDDNALGELKKVFPHLDNPLATQDEDSPMMKTFKNVVEGMGIGIVFDGVRMLLRARRGAAAASGVVDADGRPLDTEGAQMAADRSADLDAQKLEAGVQQLEFPGFGAYKNEPIADLHQGAPMSGPKRVSDALTESTRMRKEWGADQEGSMSSLTTPAQLARSTDLAKMPTTAIDELYNRALGDDQFARLMEDLRSRNMNPYEVLEESYKGFRELTEGRNVTDAMTVEEYFEPVLGGLTAEELPLKNFAEKIVVMDLMNAANAKNIRDAAIGAREIKDIADVFDTDGPMKVIADRMAFGIEQVKTARYLWGAGGRKLRTQEGAEAGAKAMAARRVKLQDKQTLLDFRRQAHEAVTTMFQVAQRSKNPDLQDALLEAFSMSNNVTNLEDLYKYFDSKLRGGDYGSKSSSMIIRELQGVMVHSVLSGPKTPIRAIMGTTSATFLRPFAQTLGGLAAMDGAQMREGLASLNAMREVLPEAFKLFRTRLNSYWSGEISTIKTKNFEFSKRDSDWEAIGELMRMRKEAGQEVSAGTEAAYLISGMARAANNSNLLTYSTKLMAATDDAFGFIMARARARQLAFREAMENQKVGDYTSITPELLKEAEGKFYANFLDQDGNVNFDTDAALKFAKEEGTLTRDLSGFSKGLDDLMGKTPWAKPFMLFARTGVNGLELTMKHMPLFNRLVKDERRILNATMEAADGGELFDLGIMNSRDLMQQRAIMKGRGAIGTGIITMASMAFMSGNLTGNGPQDRRQRQLWLDAGYRPRSIKIGNVWVNYDSFEPFNSILSHVADIGDHYELMGPEWTEKNLFKTSLVLAQGVANKSYMAGLQQLVDLLSLQPGQGEKIMASLMNNQVPLSSLRNELGRLFNPYMKELNAGFLDNIRNRNQLSEGLTKDPLPIKYDMLNGKPINDWDFPTRMFNMLSPVTLRLDQGPGRALLFNSGYDMRITAYSTPTGVNLKDSPEVRSMYQQALGQQGLEAALDSMSQQPRVQESIAQMERDRNSGFYGKDPMDYHHNRVIHRLFNDAKKRAWASISQDPKVQMLIENKRLMDASKAQTRRGRFDDARSSYTQAQEVLNMPIR